ncbi:hypothetical protein [Demequina sp. NBRC 110054]|uniref:hypothetical protein n=1 Tax=Demequina sp. NBRC 110054 TaxID=1570343 RepID=UPI0013566FA6|nr:hypothetical protein [Demequina sp. NBRC 110054]
MTTDALATAPLPPPAPSRGKGRVWRTLGLIVLVLALLAASSLAAYLWLVSSQWMDQNDTLRSEATAMGEQLAEAQDQAAALQAQVETLEGQLETTATRLSDVVNEEAHAGDDLQYLGDLIDAYANCVDSYDEVLTDALNAGYTYRNSNASSVQADVAEYCDSLAEAYAEYTAEAE